MQIRGMLCTCGKQLTSAGIENGMTTLKCQFCRGKEYYIPLKPGTLLPFPWEIERKVSYFCRKCKCEISKEQALRTYSESGKAVCEKCETD